MDYLEMKIKPAFRTKGFDARVKAMVDAGVSKAEAELLCESEIYAEMNAEAVTVYQAFEVVNDSVVFVGYFDVDGNPYKLPKQYESEVVTDDPIRLQWMQ